MLPSPGNTDMALWLWDGIAWTVTEAPEPNGSLGTYDYALWSSRGTQSCFAYGEYDSATAPYVVSDAGWSWAAGSWSPASLSPAGAAVQPDLRILGAACLSSTCFGAIAYDDGEGNNDNAVTEYANGTWSPAALPMPPDAMTGQTLIVDGATCGWDECLVSASYFDADFNLHKMWWIWSGGDWTAIPVPAADEDSFGYLACGEGICAAEDSEMDSLWMWTAGSTTVSQEPLPYEATASSGGNLACGTAECAALGTFTGTSGNGQSALFVSSGDSASAIDGGAGTYQTANPLVTLTCGAGLWRNA